MIAGMPLNPIPGAPTAYSTSTLTFSLPPLALSFSHPVHPYTWTEIMYNLLINNNRLSNSARCPLEKTEALSRGSICKREWSVDKAHGPAMAFLHSAHGILANYRERAQRPYKIRTLRTPTILPPRPPLARLWRRSHLIITPRPTDTWNVTLHQLQYFNGFFAKRLEYTQVYVGNGYGSSCQGKVKIY